MDPQCPCKVGQGSTHLLPQFICTTEESAEAYRSVSLAYAVISQRPCLKQVGSE